MTAQQTSALINPAGRLDILVLRCAELGLKRVFTPAFASTVYRQIRPVVERELRRVGVPDHPVTVDELARLFKSPQKRRRR